MIVLEIRCGLWYEFEITLLPGGHNPLHNHINYSETFTANEGKVGRDECVRVLFHFYILVTVVSGRLSVVFSDLEPGRSLRNCHVGNFREERDFRDGHVIPKTWQEPGKTTGQIKSRSG